MKTTHHAPPRLFLRLFRWFCHPELRDYIEGDLMELYEERVNSSSKRKADVKFIIEMLFLFRSGIIRNAREFQRRDYNTRHLHAPVAGTAGHRFVNPQSLPAKPGGIVEDGIDLILTAGNAGLALRTQGIF